MGEFVGDFVFGVFVDEGAGELVLLEGSNLRVTLPRERSSNNVMILP